MGKYAWSPEWREHKLPVLLWKKVIKRFDGRVKPKYLRRLMNQCNEPDALLLSKSQAEEKLRQAEKEFSVSCVRSDEMRKEHVTQLAKSLAKKNDTSEAVEMKKLSQK